MALPVLDAAPARSQFPAFTQPELDGWAMFENAGGSYPRRRTSTHCTTTAAHDLG